MLVKVVQRTKVAFHHGQGKSEVKKKLKPGKKFEGQRLGILNADG